MPLSLQPVPYLISGASAGAPAVAGNNDPIAVEILSSSAIAATAPIQNINPNGWVAKVTFKGMALGQTTTPAKLILTVDSPGFSNGSATTVTRTVMGLGVLRTPAPPMWTTGEVVAAGTRRMVYVSANNNRGYITAAGGTCGASPPTVASGSVSDGGVTWTYDPTPYTVYQEASGSDAVVYITLSDNIHTGDTITSAVIQSGAYGSSNASTASFLTITNSSTLAQEKPDICELNVPWEIVTTSLRAEIVAMHPFGQNGRTLDSLQFRVVDGSGNVVLTPALLTSMSRSTRYTTGKIIQGFCQTIDVSGLADGLYSLEWSAYPFRGASVSSATDGFGIAIPISTSAMTANFAKRIPFRKDAAGTFGRIYAYVDLSTGNDGTGAANANAGTAALTPFASISAAAAAIQTLSNSSLSRNNMGNHVIYLRSGTHSGFHISSNTIASRTRGDVWLTIARDPATTTSAADVTMGPVGTAALKTGHTRTKWSEVTILGNSTSSALDNQQAASLGNFLYETWFDKCNITGVANQRCINRFGLQWYTDCTFTLPGANFGGDTRSAFKLMAGGSVTGAYAGASLQVLNSMGVIWRGGAGAQSFDSATWAEGTGVQTLPVSSMFMFNDCLLQQGTFKYMNGNGATNRVSQGAVWSCNLTEIYMNGGLATGKGGEHSGDLVQSSMPRLTEMWNTVAGEAVNLCYNEVGNRDPVSTDNIQKRAYVGFNCWMDYNTKADFYGSSPERWSQFKVGNFSLRYHVGNHKNAMFAPTAAPGTIAAPFNIAGEVFASDWLIGGSSGTGGALDPKWTNDQSFTAPSGSKTGNGDYRPTTTSPHKSMITAADQMFPEDFGGAARKTDGTGCPGAYEWA